MADLQPPKKSVEVADPGAHNLDPSQLNANSGMKESDQMPSLNVEQSGESESSSSSSSSPHQNSKPSLPGGLQIPKTVVEKVDPESPSYGEKPGTVAYDMRKADAAPDEILVAPEITRTDLEGVPTSPLNRYLDPSEQSTVQVDSLENQDSLAQLSQSQSDHGNVLEETNITVPVKVEGETIVDDETFGDDFDEFEEGAEVDDFGEFDESAVSSESITLPQSISIPVPSSSQSIHHRPNLNFGALYSLDDIAAACQPYLDHIMPRTRTTEGDEQTPLPQINTPFFTERSQSLWAQLVAPPPLQPPDWIRSRIRRLFLVSLGVPVDLDEILPASKQKKLVLPSTHIDGDRSPYQRSGSPTNGLVGERRDGTNQTTTSNSPPAKLERRRTGVLPPPELDVHSARYMCSITEAALRNMSLQELQEHVLQLESATERAKEVMQYWLGQRDNVIGNQKAFEEVIENLVKHAQKIRK